MSLDDAKSYLPDPIDLKDHYDPGPGLMKRSAAEPDTSCPCATVAAGRRMLLAAGVGLGVGLAARMAGAQNAAARDHPKEGDLLVNTRGRKFRLTWTIPESAKLGFPTSRGNWQEAGKWARR
jgi:hypothetical protein